MQPSDERIDDESIKMLGDVKKGKPRKFVMIKDGVEINRLHVFKKGTFDRYVRLAKQGSVRGEAYWGIVRGDGVDINFELAKADGFNSPPGTQIRLKDFLKDAAGLKFEANYLIVETPTQFDEDATEEQSGAQQVSPQSAAAENLEDKFVRLLKAILPHVKQALITPTTVSDELKARVREAQDFGRQRDFEHGMESLKRVGQLAKQALAEAEAATVAAAAEQSTSDGNASPRSRKWQERLSDLEPRYNAALRDPQPRNQKLRLIMHYSRAQAAKRKFVKALVGLDRLESILAESP